MVTATRFAEPLATLPLGVSIITAEEIRVSGATTVNEAVMRLLGVPGRQDLYGGGDYNLDLRGFGSTADSNQVVVLDGVRLNEADLGGTRLAGINIDTVERIEVLRGNGAVLYGEGATGGVIVITTKAGNGTERRNTASLYTALGSYDTQELRASATLAAGGFSVDVAAQDRRSDNHRDNFNSSTDGVARRLELCRVFAEPAADQPTQRLCFHPQRAQWGVCGVAGGQLATGCGRQLPREEPAIVSGFAVRL
ncbi:MAG: TonB-dependent receptor plug domain-containing protein [Serpentinimonas sp.]|nr:TonB-dependent receptor plug domain-containing protein [Serpentinimonas sp.]